MKRNAQAVQYIAALKRAGFHQTHRCNKELHLKKGRLYFIVSHNGEVSSVEPKTGRTELLVHAARA